MFTGPRRLRGAAILAGLLAAGGAAATRAAETPAEEATQLAGEGRFEDAVSRFQEAIRREPKNSSLYLGLGLVYQSLQRYSEAIRALRKAAELAPKSPDPFYSLGLLYEAAAVNPMLLGNTAGDASPRRYRQKARAAWKNVVRLSKDPKRIVVAKEHLKRIEEAHQ